MSHSFDELQCFPIVYMNHMKPIFQDLTFYRTKKIFKKNTINVHLSHGWNPLPGACYDFIYDRKI